MYDALTVLQAAVTKITAFTSTGLDLKTGTPRRGLKARFPITNYSGASAGHTWTPTIQGSSDNTTFYTIAQAPPLTTTTAAQTAVVFLPFETSYRYVRAIMSVSGTTGTPTISYSADIGLARPG
jgi:hypothetical protein